MPATQQISVTLPNEIAVQIRARVSSGEYASESEVLIEGLEMLADRDRSLAESLESEMAAAYDEWKANPSAVFSLDEVEDELRKRREV